MTILLVNNTTLTQKLTIFLYFLLIIHFTEINPLSYLSFHCLAQTNNYKVIEINKNIH